MMNDTENMISSLEKWVEGQRDNLVRDLIDLLAYRSVAVPQEGMYPYGEGCARALDFMLDYAGRLGFRTENHAYYCGTCTLPGSSGSRSVGVFCHLDVVPEGEGWSSDPYKAFVNEDDYIVARGSSDNKGPAVAALYALRFLKEQGITLKNDIRLVYGCAEEIGMSDMDYYLSHVTPPDFSLVPDCPFPVCCAEKGHATFEASASIEGGNLVEFTAGDAANSIAGRAKAVISGVTLEQVRACMAGRGRIEVCSAGDGKDSAADSSASGVCVTALGIGKHTATPEGSVDAVHVLAEALSDSGLLTGAAREAVSALAFFSSDYYGESLGIAVQDELTGQLTHGCSMVNTGDGRINITFSIRYPVCADWEKTLKQIDRVLESRGFNRHSLTHSPANRRDPSNPLLIRLCGLVNEQLGVDFKPFGMGGGTYARKLPNAVGFGPGRPDIKKPFPEGRGWGHQPDEGVRIRSMLDMVRIYVLALIEIDRSL